MVRPTRIEAKTQLLVEGNDQRNFFEHFCEHLFLKGVEVHDFGGIKELNGFLSAFVNTPGFDNVNRLGIIRDAEQNATSAFQSVQSALNAAELSPPDVPQQFTQGIPAVAVLILPDDSRGGMLETLLCRTITDQPEHDCIDNFFRCLENEKNISIKRPDKSRAHAFLSTKEHPESSVGVAAKKGYWNLDHHALSHVRDFLTELAT